MLSIYAKKQISLFLEKIISQTLPSPDFSNKQYPHWPQRVWVTKCLCTLKGPQIFYSTEHTYLKYLLYLLSAICQCQNLSITFLLEWCQDLLVLRTEGLNKSYMHRKFCLVKGYATSAFSSLLCRKIRSFTAKYFCSCWFILSHLRTSAQILV